MRRIYFRCDASTSIGSGHVIRCITLANFLKKKKFDTIFISKKLNGNLFSLILKEKHKIISLSKKSTMKNEVKEIFKKLKNFNNKKDWMVVDHYSIGKKWESKIITKIPKLFVIDDLCDKFHLGNVLLNQNYLPGIKKKYRKVLSSKTKTLLGPKYAILNPEYKKARKNVNLKKDKKFTRVIIFFGGADDKNFTIKCLNIFLKYNLQNIKLDVVIGQSNKKKKIIKSMVKDTKYANLHIQISSLCALMRSADFYLGSGGTTTWERCSLGLPSIVIATGKNQISYNQELDKKGVLKYLGTAEKVNEKQIMSAILKFISSKSNKMSENAKKITDGKGINLISREFIKGRQ